MTDLNSPKEIEKGAPEQAQTPESTESGIISISEPLIPSLELPVTVPMMNPAVEASTNA